MPLPVFRPKYAIFPTEFRPDPSKCPLFRVKMAKLYTLFQTSTQNISNLRPKRSKSIPVFRPKLLRNHTFGKAHAYIAFLWVYPPPSPSPSPPESWTIDAPARKGSWLSLFIIWKLLSKLIIYLTNSGFRNNFNFIYKVALNFRIW